MDDEDEKEEEDDDKDDDKNDDKDDGRDKNEDEDEFLLFLGEEERMDLEKELDAKVAGFYHFAAVLWITIRIILGSRIRITFKIQ
jgi:hypothetical protein